MLISGLCHSVHRGRILSLPRKFEKLIFNMCSSYKWSISLISPDGNHLGIPLKHKESVFIGRSPETRIVDPRCSRKQVQLIADLNEGEVQAIQLGQNSSALDGVEMIKDKVYKVKPNSTLHVLTGQYPQKFDVQKLQQSRSDTKPRHKSASDTESKKPSESSKTKSRSSSLGVTPKLDENNHSKSSSDKTSKSDNTNKEKTSKKRRSSTSENKDSNSAKRQKLNGNEDEQHVKDVSAKLDLLKASAKKQKTPDKSSNNFKVPMSPASSSKKGAATSSSTKQESTSSASISTKPTTTNLIPTVTVSTGPVTESRWDQYDSLYVYTRKGLKHKNKIAGFDIDGTIITTQSGKVFPTHPGDWRLVYDKAIPKKLKSLYDDGYKIVFFTNQMGVSRGKTNITDLKKKFIDVLEQLEIPVQILVSTKTGLYRKPCPGMWNFFTKNLNGGVEVDLSQSFYVGDAAGREKNWAPKMKKDFSCGDRLFALNIGIDFKTPEEYFLSYPTCSKFTMPLFDPKTLSKKTAVFDPQSAVLTTGGQEMVLLVGYPASGKSFFAKRYLVKKDYVHINRDTMGTWQKCVAACKSNIKQGHCVVIDNTNPDKESRARYLNVAKSSGIPCRCFVFTTSIEHAKHNERFREITDKSHEAINDIIMNTYRKNFVLPDTSEGFTEIVKVNFIPKFSDPELETLYRSYLIEK